MIKMTEYAKRRKALMQKIGPTGIVIFPSAKEVVRNGDAAYPYRQDSDFYYLTGFTEPDSIFVLAPKRKEGEYILFNRVRDPDHEVWDGPRAGQAGARKHFLANQAFPISEFETMLPELLAERKTIYYPIGRAKDFDTQVLKAVNALRDKIRRGIQSPMAFVDVSPLIHEMRLFKSPAEIAMMKNAVDITAVAHIGAMQFCEPGMNECELDAVLSYEFKRQGAPHTAYGSIVASGKNACVLHYVKNDKKIANGDLVLIDAGAEYENYAADITRTFPANGHFNQEQRAVYNIVLKAQLAGIKAIKPGVLCAKVQRVITKVITQGLIELGILKGKLSALIEKKAFLPFYMHGSGHWLGLDVHDAGSYKINGKWRALKPGMVLTVEPGIYISANIPGVHQRWHNIGVRIEDDVLVTKKGCEVLSRNIPKTIADIEAVMRK
jgi:Xaa-Pro aminopeptidase